MNFSNKMFSVSLSIAQQDRIVSKREKEISVATIETNRKMEKRKNEKKKKEGIKVFMYLKQILLRNIFSREEIPSERYRRRRLIQTRNTTHLLMHSSIRRHDLYLNLHSNYALYQLRCNERISRGRGRKNGFA